MDEVKRLKPIFRDVFNFLTAGIAAMERTPPEEYWRMAAKSYERLCIKYQDDPIAADLMIVAYEELERISKRAEHEKRAVYGRHAG